MTLSVGAMTSEALSNSPVQPHGLAVALIVLSRFLASHHSDYVAYMTAAADHAASSGLPPADLAFLEFLIRSTA